MKKLFLLLIILTFSTVNAQIPIEGAAPDFTATDINGNEHHLQDYLDDGKTVILDFFATWCTPCWGYHSGHYFSEIYQAYGPDGSDEIVMLFIECDPGTGMDDLKGLTTASRGNWLEGTPYPIINDHTIQYYYPVDGYPSWIKICPDGSQFHIQGPASNPDPRGHYIGQISGCNGDLTGIENHAEITTPSMRVCDNSGINDVDFKITNYGTNDINSIEVSLKQDGATIHSETFSEETIEAFTGLSASFNDITFNSTHDYTVEITQVNGGSVFNGPLEKSTIVFEETPEAGNNLTIIVYTDYYPGEISWDIRDSNEEILISDEYEPGNENNSGGGGPDGLTAKYYNVIIPEGTQECFHINLYDDFGDGWNTDLGEIEPGIEIIGNGNQVLRIKVDDFGDVLNERYAFKTNGVLSTNTIKSNEFVIYPNPSNGIFNVKTEIPVAITITDLTGKTVYSGKQLDNGNSINLSTLQKGVYIAQIESNNSSKTEKLIIK
ncbi:hypothetical protein GCM10007424_06190 [Flavobacterium suaedae]|uniref:Thioredoxin domain-containing protein n=1 Tax=Flavobacterium suaedae TaxID=1767027 RepID=A0ABQ1JKS7_9FLAO|nr:TlpA disulfide reductase family protein [Flavobacterium suaedae]GGB68986.1 hypothetical protein GCM10007424_06190 [Flavobacterium suaedae]